MKYFHNESPRKVAQHPHELFGWRVTDARCISSEMRRVRVSVGATNRIADDESTQELTGMPVRTSGTPARSSNSRCSSRPRTSASNSGASPFRDGHDGSDHEFKRPITQSSRTKSREGFSPGHEKRPSIVAINKVRGFLIFSSRYPPQFV